MGVAWVSVHLYACKVKITKREKHFDFKTFNWEAKYYNNNAQAKFLCASIIQKCKYKWSMNKCVNVSCGNASKSVNANVNTSVNVSEV